MHGSKETYSHVFFALIEFSVAIDCIVGQHSGNLVLGVVLLQSTVDSLRDNILG